VEETLVIEDIETNVNNSTNTADQNDSTPTDKAVDHLNNPITPASADVEETLQ
jgi:hypothetical protein